MASNINICCSIEMEPKTLREVQLNLAREVAADAMQKMEPKEASSVIFIKGLESVGVEQKEKIQKRQQFLDPVECNNDQKMTPIIETPCQCSLMNVNVDSPDKFNLKEPLSAPF